VGLLALGASILTGHVIVQAHDENPTTPVTAPVQLEYTAPAECAGQDLFVERVQSRSERIQFDLPTDKQLTVTIQGRDSIWTGRVSFLEADREPLSREISAQSCDEVIDGLALVTVMVLDPEAIQPTSPELRPSTPPAASPAPSAALPIPKLKPKPRSTVQLPRALPAHIAFGADATFAGSAGPVPGVFWGWGVSAQFSWVRPSLWSPHVRASALHFSRSGYLAHGGTADFAMDELLLALCPISGRLGSLRIRPCISGNYGRLVAAGARTFVPLTETRPWVEANLQIELEWNPVSHVEVFLAPTSGMALNRYSFGFEPYVFYRVPAVILSGTAGLGLQFE